MQQENNTEYIARLSILVVTSLSSDLLKPKYRDQSDNPLFGHCYAASEALYHLLGGSDSSYRPQVVRLDPENTHWYLKNIETGEILDLTEAQFDYPVPYHKGKGCGFQTKQPSKRAQVIIDRVKAKLESLGS